MNVPLRDECCATAEGDWLCTTWAGSGEAIVFLHGWTLDHRVWTPQLSLAARYQLLMPDRRGFGRSTALANLAEESKDLLRLLDSRSIERAVVVGQSQAGRVALTFARDYPERVEGLVLVGTSVPSFSLQPSVEEGIPLLRFTQWARTGELEKLKSAWQSHPLMRTRHPVAAALLVKMLADYTGRDLLGSSEFEGEAEVQDWGGIEVPALIVTGERDTPWRQRVADGLADGLPQAQRLVLPGAGHLCNLCAPEAFNVALGGFVDALTEGRQPAGHCSTIVG